MHYEKTKDADKTWPAGSTLPEHFEPVQDILSKIESKKDMKSLTPTERAAVKLHKPVPEPAKDEPEKTDKPEVPETTSTPPEAPAILEPAKPEKPAPPAAVEPPKAEPQPASAPEPVPIAPSKDTKKVLPAKTKLAMLLGKPGADQPKSPFEKIPSVYDPSVYSKKEKKAAPPATSPAEDLARAEAVLAEVEALRKDLESQTTWDALRIQKAVYAQLLEDKKVAAKEAADMARKHVATIQKVKDEAIRHHEFSLAKRTAEIEAAAAARRDQEVAELLAVKERALRKGMEQELQAREAEASAERERALDESRAEVLAMSTRFDELVEFNRASRNAAATAAAAFALCDAVKTDKPFAEQLQSVAERSELANAVEKTIPESAAKNGVPTTAQLQHSFDRVSSRGLDASLVPEEAAGTLWAHVLGAVMARLKFSRYEMVMAEDEVPCNDEERIRCARKFVRCGEMEKAVEVLESIEKPLPREIMSDWLYDARCRCTVDRAAQALFADASIKQIALATTPPEHPGN